MFVRSASECQDNALWMTLYPKWRHKETNQYTQYIGNVGPMLYIGIDPDLKKNTFAKKPNIRSLFWDNAFQYFFQTPYLPIS